MDEWLRSNLVCPRDKQKLQTKADTLVCETGHIYPVVNEIPIMLVEEEEHIHGYITQTLEDVAAKRPIESGNGNAAESSGFTVDPFVQAEIPYTSGNLYFPLVNNLSRYPIPFIRLPDGKGERMLDVGCNWGRWSIAAAQKGYRPVGLDPSLKAILAARRIALQLGLEAQFIVGDSRFLPFESGCFDIGFSFGVFQHFSKANAKVSLHEVGRVVKHDGEILMQMPNKFGIRSFYHQARRGFREGEGLEPRYWTPSELTAFFRETFGETEMTTDCYFGLGIQKSDLDLLPFHFKMVVRSSEFLRTLSHSFPPLVKVADSVYLRSVNQNNNQGIQV